MHSGSPRKILRVVALASRTGRYGGPFDTATRQVRTLRASGVPASLLSAYIQNDKPLVETLAPGRYVRAFNPSPSGRFTSIFSIRLALATIEEIGRATTVHISFAREPLPIWAAIWTLLLRRPLILQPHGMLTIRSSIAHRIVDFVIVRRLYARATQVIALSETEATQLRKWGGNSGNTVVLGNPVPTSAISASSVRSADQNRVRLLFVARLHPRKRVSDFINAAQAAQGRGLNWNWVIVGPDEGQASLVREATKHTTNLTYIGGVDSERVICELNKSSIFVMPSEDEPWGNVLASAVAMGIPSIVTRSAALAPSIRLFSAGRVVPDHNPPAIVAAALDLLTDDNYRLASLGARSMLSEMLHPQTQAQKLVQAVSPSLTTHEN